VTGREAHPGFATVVGYILMLAVVMELPLI
jgi:hypothetical protein